MIFSEELRISILYPVKCVTDTLGSDSFSSLQNYSLIAIPREMPLLRNFPYLRLRGHSELENTQKNYYSRGKIIHRHRVGGNGLTWRSSL